MLISVEAYIGLLETVYKYSWIGCQLDAWVKPAFCYQYLISNQRPVFDSSLKNIQCKLLFICKTSKQACLVKFRILVFFGSFRSKIQNKMSTKSLCSHFRLLTNIFRLLAAVLFATFFKDLLANKLCQTVYSNLH